MCLVGEFGWKPIRVFSEDLEMVREREGQRALFAGRQGPRARRCKVQNKAGRLDGDADKLQLE